MSDPIVEVKNLRKEFNGSVAIDDISFVVKRGEIVGLLGPNGAGKTTAIQVLLGLITATSGSARIFGLDINHHRVPILQRCNFSSAYVNLPHNLKVWENLAVFAGLYGVKDYRGKVAELEEMLEISHLNDKKTGKLSSGESTRVNLCKALLNNPELLLLDEPTASLDPDIADKVRKVVRRIQKEQNTTIIYTSHNMRDVQEVCDRVLFMYKGRIRTEGTPQEVMNQYHQDNLEDVFITIARGGAVAPEERL